MPPKPGLEFAQELQDVLDNGLKATDGMGVSAAVITPRHETWLGASGMSDPIRSERMGPGMVFNIASITKNFVAALILKLTEEGKLGLEDPLHKWLPEYPSIDSTITIRQLLNHTSGIYDYVTHPLAMTRIGLSNIDLTKIWTPEEILTTTVEEPYFSPGSNWHYSTTNYVLLNMIVEEATHLKVSTELRNRLFFWPFESEHYVYGF